MIRRSRRGAPRDQLAGAALAVIVLVTVSPWALGFSDRHAAVAEHIAFAMGIGPIAMLVSALPAAAVSIALAGGWLAASPWVLGYASAGVGAWSAALVGGLASGCPERSGSASWWTEVAVRRAGDDERKSTMSALSWRSQTTVLATPEHVIDTLTDTAACARWSPVPFVVDGGGGHRLRPGTIRRVTGRVLGAPVRFQLHTLEATPRQLRLRAQGPVEIRARTRSRRSLRAALSTHTCPSTVHPGRWVASSRTRSG